MFSIYPTRILSALAISLNLGFALIIVILHLVNPEYGILEYPLSIYYYFHYGKLLPIGLIMIGIAELLTGIVQRRRIVQILFFLLGISAVLTGVFPMDMGPSTSFYGLIHVYSAFFQFGLFPVSVLISIDNIKFRFFNTFSKVLTYAMILLFFLIVYTVVSENTILLSFYGITQKVYVFFIVFWLCIFWILKLKGDHSNLAHINLHI